MAYLDQIFLLPYANLWIPALIFIAFVGGMSWFLRRSPLLAGSTPDDHAGPPAGTVALTTAGPLKPKTRENRLWSRRQGNPIEVYVADPDGRYEPERASIVDRSTGGIHLSAYREIGSGTILSVRPVGADELVPWTELEVRYCNRSQAVPGEFDVGCQFVKTPPYPILMLFG